MAGLSLHLDWSKDSKGYRLEDGQRGKEIVRVGGPLAALPNIFRNDMIFTAFAKVQTAEQAVEFANHYGLLNSPDDPRPTTFAKFDLERGVLTTVGYADGERVSEYLKVASTFRAILNCSVQDRKGLPSMLRAELEDALRFISPTTEYTYTDGAVVPRHSGMEVSSLIDGLWLQLANSVSGRIQFRACRHCGSYFKVGPGSGRRSDSEYCSEAHQIEFNSQKRRLRG